MVFYVAETYLELGAHADRGTLHTLKLEQISYSGWKPLS